MLREDGHVYARSVRYRAAPARISELDALLAALVASVRHDEPPSETLMFAVHEDRDEPEARVTVEYYASEPAFRRHIEPAPALAFAEQVAEVVESEPQTTWLAVTGIAGVLGLPR
jgi:quinol monooxygenase YgiN